MCGGIYEEEMQLTELKEMLKSHDWYYSYSDDQRYYKRGMVERERIEAEIERLTAEGFRAEACALYNEMKPSDFFEKE
jgi:hypothetical protein